jgi:urease accessory protein
VRAPAKGRLTLTDPLPAQCRPVQQPDDPQPPARWHGRLALHYQRDASGRTVAHDRHDGPLRVLKPLYPDGAGICQHVLVHPPGGFVGGDRLDVQVQLDAGAHALLTSAGASRFYRSTGARATQDVTLHAAAGARAEWLPLESIAYDGCQARNRLRFTLDAGAEMLGWDLLALGLPAAAQPFAHGRFEQHLQWPGVWLERGRLDAGDRRLLHSPLGLAGQTASATLWFASGTPIAPARRGALLDAARALAARAAAPACGATAPDARLVVVRALAPRIEPAALLLRAVWAAWRGIAWQLPAQPPRVWAT